VRYDCAVDAGPTIPYPTRPDPTLLDNVTWHALTTRQVHVAERVGRAARFVTEVSVFAGLAVPSDPAWDDLAAVVGPGGVAVLFGGGVPQVAPGGWTVHATGAGHQMVLEEFAPAPLADARPLTVVDVAEMTALVELAQPGPFRPRTIELGGYHGVFEGGRLVAMAGERQQVPGYSEISAVCTHPGARGRGLGAAITTRVAQEILARGEVPFLHHTHDNHRARRVYEALGFRFRREVHILVASPPVVA
jgi:ribosomal protein S18 acetylase RimI-like enzyme